jgi:phytol kinase
VTTNDILGLIFSYVYAFGLLFIVEAIGKKLGWPLSITRKITHIGAGMWVWGILALFDHWYFGIIPFATFILLNYIFYRQQSFEAMDSEESSPGTIYFAVSITILMVLLWRTGGALDRAPVAVAAIMAMTWGDALASLVGETWGKRTYTVFGHTRTLEGSAAMALSTFIVALLVLLFLPGSQLSPHSIPLTMPAALLAALVATFTATGAEAISPAGSDNLSVPLLTGAALYLLIVVT